jgi:hypothetical protein
LINLGTQSPASSPQAISSARGGDEDSPHRSHMLELTIEQIQTELLSVALQQADTQSRIRLIRHAFAALVKVFGPSVHSEHLQHPQICARVECWAVSVADLCRTILKRSPRWLTVHDMQVAIRKESPLTFTGCANPGVSLANILRGLERHSQVEAKLDGRRRRRWRWIGEHPVSVATAESSQQYDRLEACVNNTAAAEVQASGTANSSS